MHEKKEQFLLFRIRVHKDREAYTEIFNHYNPSLYRFLLRKLPSATEAEDAAAQTNERLWNYLKSAEVESLSGLLFTIARGVVSEYYRQRKEEASLDEHDGWKESIGDEGQEAIAIQGNLDTAKALAALLETLTPLEQNIVTLRHLDGCSLAEIARRVRRKKGSVRNILARAMKKMRDQSELHDRT